MLPIRLSWSGASVGGGHKLEAPEQVIAGHQAQLEIVLREYEIRFFAPGGGA